MATYRAPSGKVYEGADGAVPSDWVRLDAPAPQAATAARSDTVSPTLTPQGDMPAGVHATAAPEGGVIPWLRAAGMLTAHDPNLPEHALTALPWLAGAGAGMASAPLGPAAMPIAGGAAMLGEALRQDGMRALGHDAPFSEGQIISKGILAGALPQGTGMAVDKLGTMAAENLMARAGYGMTKGFGNLAPAALAEGQVASRGAGAAPVVAQIADKSKAAAADLNNALSNLDANGWRTSIRSFKPAWSKIVRQVSSSRTGSEDLGDVVDLVNQLESSNQGQMTPQIVNKLKQEAQQLSYGKAPVGATPDVMRKAKLEQRFWKAIADHAQQTLEAADPSIAPINGRLQALKGMQQVAQRAQYAKAPALGANPLKWLIDPTVNNPAVASRAALAATSPAARGATQTLPFLLPGLVDEATQHTGR